MWDLQIFGYCNRPLQLFHEGRLHYNVSRQQATGQAPSTLCKSDCNSRPPTGTVHTRHVDEMRTKEYRDLASGTWLIGTRTRRREINSVLKPK